MDESLIKNTVAANRLTTGTARRLVHAIESAQQGGADAVMVTCSSIGAAVTTARPLFDIPIFRIDEAMAETAVATGRRIGVAATLQTTLEPTVKLLEETAVRAEKAIEILPCLCERAFEAVLHGRSEEHDEIVSEALRSLMKTVDVIMLAQASMARVLAALPASQTPILSSPRLAVEWAQAVLNA